MDSDAFAMPPSLAGGSSRRLTRRSQMQPATLFTPQDAGLTPEAHFPLQAVCSPGRTPYPRFINRFDSREILVVIDGSCINNGRHANRLQDPSAGCAFIFRENPPPAPSPLSNQAHDQATTGTTTASLSGGIAFPLEKQGPSGLLAEHTSNRAKLRAVIAALQFRAWGGEGWRRVVILTDLKYIAWGATRWLPRWVARRWRKPRGHGRYGNRDLWEELQHRVEELRAQGCEVAFWLVRREGRGSMGRGL